MNLPALNISGSLPGGGELTIKQTVFPSGGDFRNTLQRAASPTGEKDPERGQSARSLEAAISAAGCLSWSALPAFPGTTGSAIKTQTASMNSDPKADQNTTPVPKQGSKNPDSKDKQNAVRETKIDSSRSGQSADPKTPATARPAPSAIAGGRANAAEEIATAQITPRHVDLTSVNNKTAHQPKAAAEMAVHNTLRKALPTIIAPMNAKEEIGKKRETAEKSSKTAELASHLETKPAAKTPHVSQISAASAADSKKKHSQTSLPNEKATKASERHAEKQANGKATTSSQHEAVAGQQTTANSPAQTVTLPHLPTAFVRITAEKIRELQAMVARAAQGMMASADGTRETVFRWNEPQLGAMSFRVTTNGDDVRLDIRADRREVAAALELSHTGIEQALLNSGLRLQTFDVQHAPMHSELVDAQSRHERYPEQPQSASAESAGQTLSDGPVNTPENAMETRKPVWVEHEWVA